MHMKIEPKMHNCLRIDYSEISDNYGEIIHRLRSHYAKITQAARIHYAIITRPLRSHYASITESLRNPSQSHYVSTDSGVAMIFWPSILNACDLQAVKSRRGPIIKTDKTEENIRLIQ